MNNTYGQAYSEVLEILKHLPEEEQKKIPKEKIKFYEDNRDKNYNFNYNITKTLDEQHVLRETKAIIITLFRDFFATTTQKEKINKILLYNEQKYQEELSKKYNYNDIFSKNKKEEEKIILPETSNENNLVPCKESIIKKIINKIKSLFS